MKSPEQILAEAAHIMEMMGKAKGVFIDMNGAVCLVGAMRQSAFGSAQTTTGNGENCETYWQAREAVDKWLEAEEIYEDAISFSDRNGAKRVIAALRDMAKRFDELKGETE